jgi:SsrA-binding protein
MAKKNDPGRKTVAVNKQARRLYFIDTTYEAGLVLQGSEVKSLRMGRSTLKEGYIRIDDGEAFLVNTHIPPYEQANMNNHEPTRHRKLLLHRKEITRLIGAVSRDGYTLVPMSIYFSRGKAKLEFGLGKGKKLHDKRQDQKSADAKLEIERAMRNR